MEGDQLVGTAGFQSGAQLHPDIVAVVAAHVAAGYPDDVGPPAIAIGQEIGVDLNVILVEQAIFDH
jgi:hypothetical protein